MAAELVETSRLLARTVAKIQPEWIEPLAGHLVKRTYSEPHWSRKRAGRRRRRAGDAARRADRRRPPRRLGRIDPETGPRAVPPPRARRGRLGHPPRVLRRQPGAARGRRGAGDAGAAARPGPSTRRRSSRSTTPGSPPTSSPGGTSTPGGRRHARQPDLLDFTHEMVRTAQAAAIDPSAYPDPSRRAGSRCRCRTRSSRAAATTGSRSTCRSPRCTRSTRRRSRGRCRGCARSWSRR